MVNRLSPAEIEFLAEKQLVSITPKFTQNHIIYLISVSAGNTFLKVYSCFKLGKVYFYNLNV